MHRTQTKLHLTGFGQFRDIETNPTSILVSEFDVTDDILEDSPIPLTIAGKTVLYVTMKRVDQFISEEDKIENDPINDGQVQRLWLHLGVHASQPNFCLEAVAVNFADFGDSGDASGVHKCGVIEEGCSGSLECSLGAERLQRVADNVNLRSTDDVLLLEMKEKGSRCVVSHDAGQYLCNYLYFRSLARLSNNNNNKKNEAEKTTTERKESNTNNENPSDVGLFLHVPSQSTVSIETQKKMLNLIVQELITEMNRF